MNALTLKEIRAHSGRTLTLSEAKSIIGNQPRFVVSNMARALQLMTWCNSQDDWVRLQAAKMVLRNQ